MRLIQAKDYIDISKKAADIIAAKILLKPNCMLGLATGSTPIGTYQNLIEKYEQGELDFSNVHSINLDEYQGLSKEHPQSYRFFMDTNFFNHINIKQENTFIPDGLAENSSIACSQYNDLLTSIGTRDLQLLGIGTNGHIGFNEPSNEFKKNVHCVQLSDSTIKANSRFFETIDDVPTFAYTMGIGNIMDSETILLLASGKEKAQAIFDSFFGPITPNVQASILQLHKDVIVIADQEALSICKEKGVL